MGGMGNVAKLYDRYAAAIVVGAVILIILTMPLYIGIACYLWGECP
jgi:hypothetical protein